MTLPAPVQAHLNTLESLLGEVVARRFFGGFGVSHAGRQFAMVMHDRLYLKADAINRAEFEAAGGEPFTFANRRGMVEVKYFALDPSSPSFAGWVQQAVAASERAAPPVHRNGAVTGKPDRR